MRPSGTLVMVTPEHAEQTVWRYSDGKCLGCVHTGDVCLVLGSEDNFDDFSLMVTSSGLVGLVLSDEAHMEVICGSK